MTRSAHVRGNLILTRQEAKEDDPETHYVKFSIFDTAGQEKYHSLTPMYYRSADAAIIVFDVARRESLASVDFWSRELASRGPEDLTVVVVANKIDHVDGRTIDEGEARAAFSRHVASRFPEAVYVEASARSGAGVDTVFGSAARAVGYKREDAGLLDEGPTFRPQNESTGVVRVGFSKTSRLRSKCSC